VTVAGVDIAPHQYQTWWPKFAGAAYTRVFVPPGGGPPTWNRPAITRLPGHVTRIGVSWKDPAPVAAVVAFVDALPDGVHLDLTWRHEPEPDWPVAEFRTGWAQLAAALAGHPHRDRVQLVNIHTLWASRHKPSVDWRTWMLPGVADVEAWDCYRDTTIDAYEPPESLFGLPYLAAVEFGSRWGIPELGATRCRWDTTGAARARWYLDCAAFCTRFGADMLGLWCSSAQTGPDLDYRPGDPATLSAWQAITTAQHPPTIS
jgi:hypothetical protein